MGLAQSVSMSCAIVLGRPSHGHDQKIRSPIVIRMPATPDASFSAVPPNSGVNPYLAAFAPHGFPEGDNPSPATS
jgi:hypothetical protein